MKFGGTSMAGIERIRHVAERVRREAEDGDEVLVVVSAMAGETDRLVQMCREAAPLYDPREYDVVVASGEQVTSGLLAITLQGMGVQARSYMGWQLPIRASGHVSALIEEIAGRAAETAAAVQLGNEAAALRTASEASHQAEALAAKVLPGDEAAAAAAARHAAVQVSMAAHAREEEAASAADRASLSAAHAAADLADAAEAMALAAAWGVHSQESALGGIRFHTAVQVALNQIDEPRPE